jgi:hypothetical protein
MSAEFELPAVPADDHDVEHDDEHEHVDHDLVDDDVVHQYLHDYGGPHDVHDVVVDLHYLARQYHDLFGAWPDHLIDGRGKLHDFDVDDRGSELLHKLVDQHVDDGRAKHEYVDFDDGPTLYDEYDDFDPPSGVLRRDSHPRRP